jgi:hypothetical protein
VVAAAAIWIFASLILYEASYESIATTQLVIVILFHVECKHVEIVASSSELTCSAVCICGDFKELPCALSGSSDLTHVLWLIMKCSVSSEFYHPVNL